MCRQPSTQGLCPLVETEEKCQYLNCVTERSPLTGEGVRPLGPTVACMALCGWYMALCGWYMAPCGWYMAPCGWYMAPCGWYMAPCGWYVAPCDWYVAGT